ncbi:pilus assembly protein [Caenimonas koreensis DSM 17982]|uniref:Pilus assembly protein n=1 Tax=Caenimonas koreensis DSM 17982 TaxID=1121255 RepID=A0A844AVS0_9BURK|nr:TfpX/TfpZ family type IV pilin accessory protein [Caenimonas koreensis]MRD48610.1 pilus assembly protein [Caenimonas koreensis DSM 17982]
MVNWNDRLRASGIHLGISLTIALVCAALVFAIWYPYPYREVSGGRELFLILVTVDVILGPLITLAVFNRAKPRRELTRDLAVVGILQVIALCYGLWTVWIARPVHLAFEIDRFRVVHGIEVPTDLLDKTPAGIDALPLGGPTLVAVRPFRSSNESADATMAALQGIQIGARPDFWIPYASAKPQVLAAAHPVADLRRRFPARVADIDAAVAQTGRSADALAWLPLTSRKLFWTALIDRNSAEIVGYIPLDPY